MTFIQYHVFGHTRTQTVSPEMAAEVASQYVRGFGPELAWIRIVESSSDERKPTTRAECERAMDSIIAAGGQSGDIGWPCCGDGSWMIQ